MGARRKSLSELFLDEIDEHLKLLDRPRPGARPHDFLALLPARNEHERNCLSADNRTEYQGSWKCPRTAEAWYTGADLGGRSDSDDGERVKPKANSLENSYWVYVEFQNMGRPFDQHIDDQELDALVPLVFEGWAGIGVRLSPDAVREAERHVRVMRELQ